MCEKRFLLWQNKANQKSRQVRIFPASGVLLLCVPVPEQKGGLLRSLLQEPKPFSKALVLEHSRLSTIEMSATSPIHHNWHQAIYPKPQLAQTQCGQPSTTAQLESSLPCLSPNLPLRALRTASAMPSLSS